MYFDVCSFYALFFSHSRHSLYDPTMVNLFCAFASLFLFTLARLPYDYD